MLVKILDADDQFVESLKHATGSTTASKAYVNAAESFLSNRELIALLRGRAEEDFAKIQRLESIIEGARSAAAQLLDKTSQQEIKL